MSSTEEESYHQGTASMSTAAGLRGDGAFTPPAPSEPLTVTEPARETPVHAVTQVLVVGGGPAGFAAALAARRAGASEVLLVERATSTTCSRRGVTSRATPRPRRSCGRSRSAG